jgi:hypothetical protein
MSWAHRGRHLLFALSLMTAACADPPNKEIQQAQQAITTARTAGAAVYAAVEFAAAEDALKRAADAVGQRDYRLALNNALDSRERAENATRDAAERKLAARAAADQALASVATLLADVQPKLRVPAGSPQAKALTPLRTAADAAEQRLQEARAAYGKSDYLAAKSGAEAATTALHDIVRDLDSLPAPAPRRRR